jgi:hypothetical protein
MGAHLLLRCRLARARLCQRRSVNRRVRRRRLRRRLRRRRQHVLMQLRRTHQRTDSSVPLCSGVKRTTACRLQRVTRLAFAATTETAITA